MLFSNKHKSNYQKSKQSHKEGEIAEVIAKRCIVAQEKASKVLQDKFETLSTSRKIFSVVAFCVISLSSCVYLMLNSFSKHTGKPFPITTLSVPKQAGSELPSSQASKAVATAELVNIIKFRGYLDSLPKSQSGKRILDSLLTNRPGLVDSLILIENMYQLQTSNK